MKGKQIRGTFLSPGEAKWKSGSLRKVETDDSHTRLGCLAWESTSGAITEEGSSL